MRSADEGEALERLKTLTGQLDAARQSQKQAATELAKAKRTTESATKAVKRAVTSFRKRRASPSKPR